MFTLVQTRIFSCMYVVPYPATFTLHSLYLLFVSWVLSAFRWSVFFLYLDLVSSRDLFCFFSVVCFCFCGFTKLT